MMTDLVMKHLMSTGCELGTLLNVMRFLTDNPQLEDKVVGMWDTNRIDILHDIIGLLRNDEHFIPRVL